MKVRMFLVFVALFTFIGSAFAEDFPVKPATMSSDVSAYEPGELLVKFRKDVTPQKAQDITSRQGTTVLSAIDQIGSVQLRIPTTSTVEEMVDVFRKMPDVEYAEPNYIASTFAVPNDPYYSYQWHFPLVHSEQAWNQSTGSGVVVAVVDAGVAYETYSSFTKAPDLAGTSFVAGWDFVNNDAHPNDDNAHGTHVAGTIAQTTNNSLGVAGLAYNCSIMPVKVLNAAGNGTHANIANGIIWAADHGAKVINLSLGGPSGSSTLQNAITYASNAGVTIVCAAGNAGTSAAQYPAAYSQCISVSAVRYDKTRPAYSSYGSTIDICAPGGDVSVDQNGDGYPDGVLQQTHNGVNYGTFGYYFYEGTSMASPHVAALAAMLIAKAGGSLTPAQVRAAIQNTAEDLGAAGWDNQYGYGLINADAALQSIGGGPAAPVANFIGSPTSGTAPLNVSFTDQSTGSITSWSWTFGDGGTSTSQNPSHNYTSAGTYSVSLTVTGPGGSNNLTRTNYITVNAACNAPVANFSGSPTSGVAPLSVSFTDLSSNSPTAWSWNFGDGGTSTAQNPSHNYTSAGTYTVTLTASNACGSDPETKTSYITVTPPSSGWTTITYDDFESNFGSYTDGGNDCSRYTGGTYAWSGNAAIDVQDNTGTPSSFYHTGNYNVTSYSYQEVEFHFVAVSMEVGENFFVEYYSGSTWVTLASFVRGTDFNNNTFYTATVSWNSSQVAFPSNAKLRFRCDAGDNNDDVYIDAITWRGSATGGSSAGSAIALSEGRQVKSLLPEEPTLAQNYPNPFNPSTEISFTLSEESNVKLEVYNLLGERVSLLLDQRMGQGVHSVTWNAGQFSSGVYFYRLTTEAGTLSKKMMLLK